jgi:hypothetical protein
MPQPAHLDVPDKSYKPGDPTDSAPNGHLLITVFLRRRAHPPHFP